jgi:hypothetical protein
LTHPGFGCRPQPQLSRRTLLTTPIIPEGTFLRVDVRRLMISAIRYERLLRA